MWERKLELSYLLDMKFGAEGRGGERKARGWRDKNGNTRVPPQLKLESLGRSSSSPIVKYYV